MSNAVLSKANNLKFEDDVKEALPDLDKNAFVRDNIAVVHIYYENQHSKKNQPTQTGQLSFKLSYS